MKKLKLFSTLIVAFIFTASTAVAQTAFISAADFVKLSKDKNTRVISSQSKNNYKVSHIKNAVYIDIHTFYDKTKAEGVLTPVADIAKYFGEQGISEKNNIVIYDDGTNKYSTRLYWILKYLGAPNVKILMKDMDEWRKVRVPITKAPSKITKTVFTPKLNKSIIIDYATLSKSLTKYTIIDARAVTEYNGTSTKPVSKGHIAGAISIEWSKVENKIGVFKPNAEIEKIFSANGVTKSKPVVVYCGTGVRAAVLFVALQELGYKVTLYDGSYNEWEAKGGKLVK